MRKLLHICSPQMAAALALLFLCINRGSGATLTADLCVYGATSGGVAAAVQAARMGKSVLLLEPGKHVGGMTSGGLGLTDTGNRGTIGGISREFYRRVGRHYGVSESFTFEPKVAEQVFLDMLQESKVTVHYEHRLASVQKTGRRITRLVMENGVEVEAKVFIDTTYEGDLLALAGVSFTVGREPVSLYNESLNGIRGATPAHQFALAVDPYRVPGDNSSGLLPHIQPGDGGTPGEGDHRVQAYNFRLCLTQVATNRLPIAPPANYDPAEYELLGRYVQARVAAGHNLTLGSFLKIDSMPNGKTDINNNGAFSTDFIGRNYTYPTNTHAERARIRQEHEDYIRGLLTFLATDSRIPTQVRTSMQTWGLCRDEFLDTGGWPHQLYVREARRMVSDYVITQADCERSRVAADSVGLASYNMDSHNCQRIVKEDAVHNEGDVQKPPAGPFPISYRAIVPRIEECENLAATFCLSGTHIAFSSCRMEPVFMVTSQCAATAAAIAIDDDLPMQQVDYGKLRLYSVADGQVLQWSGSTGTTGNGIILDSENPGGIEITGTWSSSSSQPGYFGSNYLHDQNTGKGTKSVRFTPQLTNSGNYTVYLRWTTNPNRAANVPVTIQFAGGTTNLTVNQQQSNGVWVPLGTLPFSAGTSGNLLLSTVGTDGYVIADAAMWEALATPVLPVVEVISTDRQATEAASDPATVTFVRSENLNQSLEVHYSTAGTATPGSDYPTPAGRILIPAGQASATLTIRPRNDLAAEGEETITLQLLPNPNYTLGVFTNETLVVHDGGFGAWRALYFSTTELADADTSGPNADPDLDAVANVLEYFAGTSPKIPSEAPPLHLNQDAGGWLVDWQRKPGSSSLFLRLESSADLVNWTIAPWPAQVPRVTRNEATELLRFELGPRPTPGKEFYRAALSLTPLSLVDRAAHCFFSFDTHPGGDGGYTDVVTTNYGFTGTPTVMQAGTVLAEAGGASAFTDFSGVLWLGSGTSSTPGHSATFNPGSVGNQFALTFSTSGLRQIKVRMDIRSAAQAGGSAPNKFEGLSYDVGGGAVPVLVALPPVLNDGQFREWTLDLSALKEIENQEILTLTWSLEDLGSSPAESFRIDNVQISAVPLEP